MKNFRTFNQAVEFYHSCLKLKLTADARDQLLRAARSIALNLAEGSGRRTLKDQRRFFNIAFASLRECQAVLSLELLKNTEEWKKLDKLAAHTFQLIKNVQEL
jgi:four helix bundle protein